MARDALGLQMYPNIAFTLGRKSLDKSLQMRLKTLLATLFSGSVHISHMLACTCRLVCVCVSVCHTLVA